MFFCNISASCQICLFGAPKTKGFEDKKLAKRKKPKSKVSTKLGNF